MGERRSDQPTRSPGLEIIVIDDGSTDSTVRIARRFGAPVKCLRQTHKGKPAALNRGLAIARGAIIITVDADTIVEPRFLASIVQPLRDPTVAAASGPVLVANDRSVIGAFQRIEYHYNNLIRQSFSAVFRNGIWFFGCLARTAHRRYGVSADSPKGRSRRTWTSCSRCAPQGIAPSRSRTRVATRSCPRMWAVSYANARAGGRADSKRYASTARGCTQPTTPLSRSCA